jgi:hypothetical protein
MDSFFASQPHLRKGIQRDKYIEFNMSLKCRRMSVTKRPFQKR